MGPNVNLGQLRVWAQTQSADESEEIAMATFRELDAHLSAGGALPNDWNPCGLVWIEKAGHGWKALSRKVPGAVYTLKASAELWLLALDYPSGASVMWTAFTSEADARRNAQEHENGYK
jgi:hypothetical protein